MMKFVTVFGFMLIFSTLRAQDSYYNFVELGNYNINYCDSVIYDKDLNYNQFGYNGYAPLFVQIWYPSNKTANEKYLKFGDFSKRMVSQDLKLVYNQLNKHIDTILIKDAIETNADTYEPINYEGINAKTILQEFKLMPTKSQYVKLSSVLNFPVIVYHHGAQGSSFENSVMAEYFASKGYIFISANFHLPYSNTIFGLIPHDIVSRNKHDQSDTQTLINFTRSISNNKNVFFIGHSWGAQEGWCLLHKPSLVNAFVSMETTIEYKSDTTVIKKNWPQVYDALKVKKNKFSIPILLFAGFEDNLSFDFFRFLSTEQMVYASYKEFFDHNSYTSVSMMRYFLRSKIKQPDIAMLKSQILGYSEHLKVMDSFFQSTVNNKKMSTEKFEHIFYFNR